MNLVAMARQSGIEQAAGPVSRQQSEALLTAIAAKTADPVAGVFGPRSTSWKVNRESALFLGAGRAALLQLAHPWVATAMEQHSRLAADPIARFHNTFRIVFTMIFGSLGQAMAAARNLHALHAKIEGQMAQDAGAYRRDSHYQANEIAALRWVYATLADSAVLAYEWVLPPLTAEERDAYYAESKALAALFGLPADSLPADWDGLQTYMRAMFASQALSVTAGARAMGRNVLAGAGSWIHPPRWYRALTTSWLPPRLQEEFALMSHHVEGTTLEKTRRRASFLYGRLPSAIRFVGPWREAQARLRHEPVGPATRWSNRFWIGQPTLPYGPPG